MIIETFLIFMSTIVSLNASNVTPAQNTSVNKTEVTKTTIYTPPASSERKRGGWDGN
jgi:hypothetical protein